MVSGTCKILADKLLHISKPKYVWPLVKIGILCLRWLLRRWRLHCARGRFACRRDLPVSIYANFLETFNCLSVLLPQHRIHISPALHDLYCSTLLYFLQALKCVSLSFKLIFYWTYHMGGVFLNRNITHPY